MRNKTFLLCLVVGACGNPGAPSSENETQTQEIQRLSPAVVTQASLTDTDDPAIWINRDNPSASLILGTDKGDENGGIYVYDLKGTIDKDRTVLGLKRPNNVDVEYGLSDGDTSMDIAVCTERGINSIRVFKLPEMLAIDNSGIRVFADEPNPEPMGVALYKKDSTVYAIVGRKSGPQEGYLEQLRLELKDGVVVGVPVRKFGKFSGKKEIESIAVDDELGYVYYSDENFGVRKYYADPAMGNEELAAFGQGDFTDDNEGISIYDTGEGRGYILVSDQQNNSFNVYPREGSADGKHQHPLLSVVHLNTVESDGSDVVSTALGEEFPSGMFVAMSDDKTFQIYSWDQISKELKSKEN